MVPSIYLFPEPVGGGPPKKVAPHSTAERENLKSAAKELAFFYQYKYADLYCTSIEHEKLISVLRAKRTNAKFPLPADKMTWESIIETYPDFEHRITALREGLDALEKWDPSYALRVRLANYFYPFTEDTGSGCLLVDVLCMRLGMQPSITSFSPRDPNNHVVKGIYAMREELGIPEPRQKFLELGYLENIMIKILTGELKLERQAEPESGTGTR